MPFPKKFTKACTEFSIISLAAQTLILAGTGAAVLLCPLTVSFAARLFGAAASFLGAVFLLCALKIIISSLVRRLRTK